MRGITETKQREEESKREKLQKISMQKKSSVKQSVFYITYLNIKRIKAAVIPLMIYQ